MPPRPPVPGCVRINLFWSASGGTFHAHNILYAQFNPAGPADVPADLQTFADDIFSLLSTGAHPLTGAISNDWFLVNVFVESITGLSAAQATSTHAAVGGSLGGNTLPPQCAAVISWGLGRRYRGGKPRTYVAGISETAQVSNLSSQMSATYAAILLAAAEQLRTGISALTIDGAQPLLGTVSYFLGVNPTTHKPIPRTTPVFEAYVATHIHERLASQRRRSLKEALFPVL
jgi:hypothetical protein